MDSITTTVELLRSHLATLQAQRENKDQHFDVVSNELSMIQGQIESLDKLMADIRESIETLEYAADPRPVATAIRLNADVYEPIYSQRRA